jgi:hypothetical protein
MFMKIRTITSKSLAVLALCALALTTFAAHRDPIHRPFKVKGELVFIVSQDAAALGETVGAGEGGDSHLGKFEINTAGSYDFESGDFVGEGVMTAANGDLLYFKMRSLGWLQFTGGTGRFENATGELALEPTASPEQMEGDGQLIVAFSFTGEGTITYSRHARTEIQCHDFRRRQAAQTSNRDRLRRPVVGGQRRVCAD